MVSNEIGKSERPLNIRRYAAVLAPGSGQIGWSELGADGPIAVGATPVADARWLALSSDGRAGYVAEAHGGTIDVIDLPAPGAPKVDLPAGAGRRRPSAGALGGRAGAGLGRGAGGRRRPRRHQLAAASGPQRAARVPPGGAGRQDRRRRHIARWQAAGARHRGRQPGGDARSRTGRAHAGRGHAPHCARGPRERPLRRGVRAGGRHALGAFGRHPAQRRGRSRADGAPRCPVDAAIRSRWSG